MKSKITQKELGRLCGVSAACVGYILSGSNKYKFKPETVEKVRRMAEELNYRPNYQASCLRKKSNNLLFCIVGCACRYTDSLHLKYLVQEAEKAGFQLLVQFIVGLSDEKKLQFIRNIINIPAGIFIWSCGFQNPESAGKLPEILHNAPPMMHLNHAVETTGMDYITVNWGGRSFPGLLKYFADHNIRRMGCCVGGRDKNSRHMLNFPALARQYGIDGKVYAPEDCRSSDYYRDAGEIAAQLLKEKELPEVLYCVSDVITLVLMDVFRRNGIDVPGDIKIISGGDSEFLNYLPNPPPVLRHNIPLLAEKAVTHLVNRINNNRNDIGENICVAQLNQGLLFPDGSVCPLPATDKI